MNNITKSSHFNLKIATLSFLVVHFKMYNKGGK